MWWLGVFAAGVGVLVPGLTGRRIGVMAGAALFIVAAAVVALLRRGRYATLARAAARASKYDVLHALAG
ncbi:Integral membrane protein OS=Streptomyces albaduncus OX=68172 GN=FHS32_006259 PE=4 SV=1 [Streptomyces griseoloalbus]